MRERERERERERVTGSPSFPRRHKILFGSIITIGVILYVAFNLWVYQYSKGGTSNVPAAFDGGGKGQLLKGDSLPKQGVTFTGLGSKPAVTPSPFPRPIGPGQYACDEYGICNNYEDAKRVGCPKTYADPHCLNECGDKNIRCLKPK